MGKLFVQRKASPCLPPVAKVAKDEPEIKTRGRGWDLSVKCIGRWPGAECSQAETWRINKIQIFVSLDLLNSERGQLLRY